MNQNSRKHPQRHDGMLPSDGTADADLARKRDRNDAFLPHERDESPDPQRVPEASREHIEQAARDVRRGLRDTDRRGTPSDVPGPGHDPETTPGAQVPPPRPGGGNKAR